MTKINQYPPVVAGGLLGLGFVAFGLMFLLGMVPDQEPPPEGSPAAMFFGAMIPTGYFTFIKVLEVLGGLLVLIPKTRNLGLLLLVPIVVNIIAYHAFIGGPEGFADPVLLVIVALTAYLLVHERGVFIALINRPWHKAGQTTEA
ncbi:MAG: DoxX family protein [Planctomycetota bacterium]